MTSDPLSRLRDGLARDAEIARAAAGHGLAEGEPGEWRTDESCGTAEISAGGVRRENGYGGTGIFGSVTVARELAIEDAAHIATFDPARVLRQVEAIQEVLNIVGRAMEWGERDPNAAYADIIAALASIYTEDTEEAGR